MKGLLTMRLEKAVNHGGHSEHGEKQDQMWTCSIPLWVIPGNVQDVKLLALPAVFAVVN